MANLAHWYESAAGTGDFEQGDIFTNATIPNTAVINLAATQQIPTRLGSFVVLTQSCDVPKAETILLAELFQYSSLLRGEQANIFRKAETKAQLIRNRFEHYFLIPPYTGEPTDWALVSFRHLHVVAQAILSTLAADSAPIRMASPYKEYLGQSFARFMMRVALPEPMDEFKAVRFD